jgi:hypothetical protein
MNPRVYQIVFALIDEIIDAFDADAVHVGMDEVFLIGNAASPATKGKDPAEVYAKAVNDMYGQIVKKRGRTMLMWGDRLLDARAMHGGEWEYAKNGTAGAVDLITKDIVICDWHYENQGNYPSVPFLLGKGFHVWPAGWQPLDGAQAFSKFARQQNNQNITGFLCTVWGREKVEHLADWPPIVEVLAGWK